MLRCASVSLLRSPI